jgi:hypothetical protein
MRPEFILRWLGRVWGIASAIFLMTVLFGGSEHLRPTFMQAIRLPFFPVGVITGFVVAWYSDAVGGLITVASLALFYAWMFGRDGRIPSTPYFLLFAAPGFLHILSELIARRHNKPTHAPEN